MLLEIAYDGGHNFDWDTRLEHLAGKRRHSSSMDFESLARRIVFEFDNQTLCDGYIAAVHNEFPEFTITKLPG